ncbi:bifunctional DNA primase/polymerase, partial [Nocardia brasiliensis]|uniref:bifunctional DNA primase/polymerase n=1 Tax=Nocardia brasiliensis TaxID=37326 RepID=UPI002455FF1C
MDPYHFRDAALHAARRGWHVFPLRPRSKIPAIKNWEQQATTEPTRINDLWPHNSSRNVGIACGPSRLHVIDLDRSHGGQPLDQLADGWVVLAQLAAATGHTMPLPTHTVATPSGGFHLYYHTPPKLLLRNSINRLGPHIDTRGSGGYVVATGSILAAGQYRVLDDRPPILLPHWLVVALSPPPDPRPTSPPPPPRNIDAYAARAIDNQTARIRAAATGTRHQTLLLAANSLGRPHGPRLQKRPPPKPPIKLPAPQHKRQRQKTP